MNPPPLSPRPPAKRGLLFYGCLTALVLFLVAIVAVVVGTRWAIRTAVNTYTSTSALPLPKAQLTPAEEAALQRKLADFFAGFERGEGGALELDGVELNALLAENTDLKDRVSVSIREGQLRGQLSLPLDQTGLAQLKGRWVNGDADLDLGGREGRVWLRIKTLTVNGKVLPGQIQAALANENLVEKAAEDPRTADYLERVENVAVEQDRVVVKFKPAK
jgi:hypothetical protein